MIYTFYSYKGGVGRTMALANVAELFYRKGLKVLMIDWDLEAPGLEQFFFPDEEKLTHIRAQLGLMDLVSDYKTKMTQAQDLSDPENFPFRKPGDTAIDIYPGSSEAGPKLRLITAGRRRSENPAEYANAVLTFDWRDFYKTWQGEAYFDWFRRECEKMADVILIDSRTGVTEIGGVCTYHLADVIVLFCAANNQNIRGTLEMVQNFSQPKVNEVRGGRPLRTIVVPARIDTIGEIKLFNLFYQKLLSAFAPHLETVRQNPKVFEHIRIPYISSYAFEELIAVKQVERSGYYAPDLIEAYTNLRQILETLAREVIATWQRRIAELTEEWERLGQQFAEVNKRKIFETRNEEKSRFIEEIRHLEQEQRAVEETLRQVDREFQYHVQFGESIGIFSE